MSPHICSVCRVPILVWRKRYVIRGRLFACIGCVEERSRFHQLIAPDCATPHHDAYDHADRMTLTTADGA